MVKVVFLHPDLGIGGAERLILDAALALERWGHKVHIVTAHHDKKHCFPETICGLNVTCVGDWLPRSIFGFGHALCAYVRMIYIAMFLVFFSDLECDVVVCDLISVCIPVLKMRKKKVLFYCHFPDQLLTRRENVLKKIYRFPIDFMEETTVGMADKVLVNSKFTAAVFQDTFRSLTIKPEILYPSINLTAFDAKIDDSGLTKKVKLKKDVDIVFISINRYERKKNISLALKALAFLFKEEKYQNKVHLIIAGGYDERVAENVDYHSELVQEAESFSLSDNVTFLKSIDNTEKLALLHNCTCLIYTPENEHFGIVPLEAMYMSRPVIAANSGGPMETIIDGVTGVLCYPTPNNFTAAMKKIADDKDLAREMGIAGREHVKKNFSFNVFTDKLHSIICQLVGIPEDD